ncbi:MAG: NusG domain II-containing protein [Faecousia sp.]
MKTRTWIALLCGVFLICLILGIGTLLPREDASLARITSQGKVVKTVNLKMDQQFTVTTPEGGVNVITVRDGKIAVTEASCPDHYCMNRGFCASGTDIVCLPNRLVIHFLQEQAVDAAVG